MNYFERIEWDPQIRNGKPVIKGTRIPLSLLLEQIAEGESWEALLTDYPELTRADIQATLFFAQANIEHADIRHIHA